MRYHSELEVDFRILKDNFDLLKGIAPSNEIIFMIKADAYGHGLLENAQFSYKELGIKNFGLASLGEAVRLRKSLPSLRCNLFVFSDTALAFDDVRDLYVDYNIFPVLASLEDLEDFLEDRRFSNAPLVLKINTGLNRLGITADEVSKAILMMKSKGRFVVDHLMTHFSSSFKKHRDGDKTDRQLQLFQDVKKQFNEQNITINETSCSNSGAIEQGIGLGESHIRPGLMLYGPGINMNDDGWQGRNVSSLKTYVLKTMPVKRGMPIGYGGHVCHEDGIIAYLPIGYGDGILTYYSKSEIEVNGHVGRILGRVNMDVMALWFPMSAEKSFKRGQILRLWDHDRFSATKFAMAAKTIPYQIFTAMGSRVPRVHII
ncbi:MAG: alanine racemase [Bacteriovoracaceae bacterium]|nr:alanine racemase [Bacteriovoracaceae bacterium]